LPIYPKRLARGGRPVSILIVRPMTFLATTGGNSYTTAGPSWTPQKAGWSVLLDWAGMRWLCSVVRLSGPSTISVAPAAYGPSTAAGFLSCIATGQLVARAEH